MTEEAHVSKYKKRIVEKFVKLIKEYPIIGAVNLENMPTPQLQKMKETLRKDVQILMSKRRIMKIAIEQCKDEKKGIEKIEEHLKGMPALLFTKENPFKLYKAIQKNKSKAPAKAGQTAPNDIVVPAGPTPFAPGPVIGELGAVGIKTAVEGGKIAISEDSVVVKEGEKIKASVAEILTRLGIEPMEVGLDLVAVYEDGVIYDKDVLAIDEDAFIQSLSDAATWAINLAVEIGYYTKETVKLLVPKAFLEAKAVALEGNIMCDLLAEELVEKAERGAASLKAEANISDAPAPKEEPKVEKKPTEEKKEQAPAEKPAEVKEKPKEEAKVEENPTEEKKEELKVEEKPKEDVKEEPKAEEPEPEKPIEKSKQEVVEEKQEEVEKEIKEVKEDIEKIEQEKKLDIKEVEKVEEKVEEIKEKQEEVEEIEKEVKKEATVEEIKEVAAEEIEAIKGKEEEVKEDIEHIKEEVKEMKKEEKPDIKEVEKVEEEIKEVEEDIKEVKEAKQIPEPAIERAISEEKKKIAEEGAKLFEELKKKGTLRDHGKREDEKKVSDSDELSPADIIKKHQDKMLEEKKKKQKEQ